MEEKNNETLSFSDMFPHTSEKETEDKENITSVTSENETPTNKAAAELFSMFSESENKDKRTTVRFKTSVYNQLQAICRKKGLTVSGAITMWALEYIKNNKDLLDD
jgi:hypothetical protein